MKTQLKVDEKSDIWKLPDLIEKILISGIPAEGIQAKRVKAMLSHLKPIMRECKVKVFLRGFKLIILTSFLIGSDLSVDLSEGAI